MTPGERLELNSIPITESGCIIWLKGIGRHGYGKIKVGGKTMGAHRVAWQMAHGDIPDGAMVCHRCDVPPCINVDHLFLGTAKDNVQDAIRKGRFANDEQREFMRSVHKGNTIWLGRHHTDETKAKLSLSKIGNTLWLGRKHTPESRLKMSLTKRITNKDRARGYNGQYL